MAAGATFRRIFLFYFILFFFVEEIMLCCLLNKLHFDIERAVHSDVFL